MAKEMIADIELISVKLPSLESCDGLYQAGLMYSCGRGVEVDLVAAHKWFNLAALKGNEEAKKYREEISAEMDKKEIFKAQKEARKWLSLH